MPEAPDLGDNAAAATRRPSPRQRPDDGRKMRGKRMNIVVNTGNVELKRFSKLLAKGSAYPPNGQTARKSAVLLFPR